MRPAPKHEGATNLCTPSRLQTSSHLVPPSVDTYTTSATATTLARSSEPPAARRSIRPVLQYRNQPADTTFPIVPISHRLERWRRRTRAAPGGGNGPTTHQAVKALSPTLRRVAASPGLATRSCSTRCLPVPHVPYRYRHRRSVRARSLRAQRVALASDRAAFALQRPH